MDHTESNHNERENRTGRDSKDLFRIVDHMNRSAYG